MIPAIDPNSFRQQVERVILRGDPLDGARPVWCARAPGRIDFMGGNVDYTGGLALQIPTIWAIFQPSHEPVLRIFNPEAEAFGWATVLEPKRLRNIFWGGTAAGRSVKEQSHCWIHPPSTAESVADFSCIRIVMPSISMSHTPFCERHHGPKA